MAFEITKPHFSVRPDGSGTVSFSVEKTTGPPAQRLVVRDTVVVPAGSFELTAASIAVIEAAFDARLVELRDAATANAARIQEVIDA